MADHGDWIELKFRLGDGTDIGPSKYSRFMTIASLKEIIIAQWPRDKENAPKMIDEVKLINGGKILENDRTLFEASSLPGIVTTMHVVLRPPTFVTSNEKLHDDHPVKIGCACFIL